VTDGNLAIIAAMLIAAVPLLLSRAADRSGPLPRVPFWPTPGDGEQQATRPADEPPQQQ